MKSVEILTEDHYPISAHLFEPENSNGKILLINSATGVKQQIYFSFAHFFSEKGFTVITYDYRGIGESKPKKLKKFKADMRIWGRLDFKAMTNFIKENYPNFRKYCLGHSIGALILGMNEDSKIFEKFIFAATQKAYIGNLRLKTKLEGIFGFGILLPLFNLLLGYFPAEWFGLGENLPKGCARDWRTLILNKKSTNKLLESVPDFSKTLTQNVLILNMEDDPWVTQKGIETLLKETYPNLKPEIREVKISESEHGKIGHINFFRRYNQNLWNILIEVLS
ncbi:MAG: alpha/beta hydrolase [Flavobacteriaceae bacterium]|jgi:predicted alpha/beta hydrolase|nr:alpha/beta hydrolase [Flavobacteriaceae bacterium]